MKECFSSIDLCLFYISLFFCPFFPFSMHFIYLLSLKLLSPLVCRIKCLITVCNPLNKWLDLETYMSNLKGESEEKRKRRGKIHGKNNWVSFRKINGFLGKQNGDKEVCDVCLFRWVVFSYFLPSYKTLPLTLVEEGFMINEFFGEKSF